MKELVVFENYSQDFIWDKKLHFPIPTLNYVLNRTGQDLLLLFDTQEEAKGAVLAVVRTAKNFLFRGRRDILEWEWHIAHSIGLLYEVLEYLMEFINFAFISGNYDDFYKILDDKKKVRALEEARSILVGAKKVNIFVNEYRKDY